MEATATSLNASSTAERLGMLPILGASYLTVSSILYAYFGWIAYPRQEWLLETEISIIFLLPVMTMIRRTRRREAVVRLIGGMLILHSLWDALHWPGHPTVQTPVNPWLPWICPLLDLPIGACLWIAGNAKRST